MDQGRILVDRTIQTSDRVTQTTRKKNVKMDIPIHTGRPLLAEEIPVDFQLTGTEILKVGNLVDVTISDPSLEEVIRVIYEEAETTRESKS